MSVTIKGVTHVRVESSSYNNMEVTLDGVSKNLYHDVMSCEEVVANWGMAALLNTMPVDKILENIKVEDILQHVDHGDIMTAIGRGECLGWWGVRVPDASEDDEGEVDGCLGPCAYPGCPQCENYWVRMHKQGLYDTDRRAWTDKAMGRY